MYDGTHFVDSLDRATGSKLGLLSKAFAWGRILLVMFVICNVVARLHPAYDRMAVEHGYKDYTEMMRDVYPRMFGKNLGSIVRICATIGTERDFERSAENLGFVIHKTAQIAGHTIKSVQVVYNIINEIIEDENYFSKRMYWGAKKIVKLVQERMVTFLDQAYEKVDPEKGESLTPIVLMQFLRDGKTPALKSVEEVNIMANILDVAGKTFTEEIDWEEVKFTTMRDRPMRKNARFLRKLLNTGQLGMMMAVDEELAIRLQDLMTKIGGSSVEEFIENCDKEIVDYAAFDEYRVDKGWYEIMPRWGSMEVSGSMDMFGRSLKIMDHYINI